MQKETEETSLANRRRNIFKKYQGLIRKHKETANFQEPILILMRRTQKAEFYENATKGNFTYTHSDGEDRTIMLNPRYLQTFDYGKKNFKGYICHEDFPLPLPEEPTITGDMVGTAIDKTLHDVKKWKISELNAKSKLIYTIAIAIAIIGGIYILYKLVINPTTTPTEIKTAQTIVQNTSIAVLGG